MVSLQDKICEALEQVMDPHFNVSLGDMGMIRRVVVNENNDAEIGIVFPCIGCPAWTLIQQNIKTEVSKINEINQVKVNVDWDSMWDRSDMSEHAKAHAQSHGYRI